MGTHCACFFLPRGLIICCMELKDVVVPSGRGVTRRQVERSRVRRLLSALCGWGRLRRGGPPDRPLPWTGHAPRRAIGRGLFRARRALPLTLRLERGQLFFIEGTRGTRLRCDEGEAWVTQAGDDRDHLLSVGLCLPLKRTGRVVIQARAACRMTLAATGETR